MQNHVKGATARFTDLAHILQVGITWGSIHKNDITLVQASFLCVSHGVPPFSPFHPHSKHEFCKNLNVKISCAFQSKLIKTNCKQS